MESTRPIRALMRGLEALTVLNLRDGATVSEVVQEIRLPRTTVYRILETLCDAGFVYRDGADDRYRLTILVRSLSDGFDDESWVTQIARPCIHDLAREVVWPLCIATLSGTTMLVRETTDHVSPLATLRYSAGFQVPLLTSAAGLAFLAHCPAAERDQLIDALSRSNKPEDKPARARSELLQTLNDIRSAGFATANRSRHAAEELTISVPLALDERVLGGLSVRVAAEALPPALAPGRFVPKLRECAAKIRAAFSEHRPDLRPKGAAAAAN